MGVNRNSEPDTDYSALISDATQRLERNPRDLLALMERADAFMGLRDGESALRDVDCCLEIALSEPRLRGAARQELLSRLYILQSRALLGLGDGNGALDAVEEALRERASSVEALVQRGRIFRDFGDPRGALEDFDAALALDQNSVIAYIGRGMARYELQDYGGAIADYDRAIALDERDAIAWSNRGNAYFASGDYERAAQDCRTALELDPRLIRAYEIVVYAYRQQNRHAEAVRVVAQGLEYQPDEPRLLVEAARLCLDKNKCEQALSISNKILRQQPDHSEAYALRGQSYGRTGDYTAAIADLRRATQLDPENGEHHFNLALAYLHSGDPTAAADTLERVLSLNPHDEEALALYGRLTQQSEASDAEDSEQIPDEEPSQGEIFFVQGEHKKAFKEWDREIAAARKARDFKGQARLLLLAGKRYFQVGRGRIGELYLNQGLKLAQQEEDLVSILEGHVQLLFLALSEQRWQVLMQHARQLLAIGRALDVAAYEHMGLANLGMAYGQTGRVEEGVRLIAQARDIAHQVGDKANEAVYCHQLGHFYVNLMRKFPRYAYDALEMFERAQRLQSEMGARPDPDLNGLIRQLRAALYG